MEIVIILVVIAVFTPVIAFMILAPFVAGTSVVRMLVYWIRRLRHGHHDAETENTTVETRQ